MPITILRRYLELHRLLVARRTGSRDDLARRFHISVRTLYRYRDGLVYLGAEIAFDKMANSYYYVTEPSCLANLEQFVSLKEVEKKLRH